MDDIKALLGQILILSVLGGMVLLLEKARHWISTWWQNRLLHPLAKAIQANKDVQALLIELRAKTDADRVYLYLFHNGQSFSNLSPIWKLTCTQEVCKPGITHELSKLQGILASTVWEMLAPFFGEKVQGVDQIDNDVYVIFTEKMYDCHLRQSMTSRGIQCKIFSPMRAFKSQTVVGMVVMSYNDADLTDRKKLPKEIEIIQEYAHKINFALRTT